jgi:hypothetical protein
MSEILEKRNQWILSNLESKNEIMRYTKPLCFIATSLKLCSRNYNQPLTNDKIL